MKTNILSESQQELNALCASVRSLISKGEFDTCEHMICQAMEQHPHAPEPHNLLGILLEQSGDHSCAMKHFRAAWALDPNYRPASQNLSTYGTFFSKGRCAYDESDCPPDESGAYVVEYDRAGIQHIVRRRV